MQQKGSDWFWWYGDDFDTQTTNKEFDRLFPDPPAECLDLCRHGAAEILNQPLVEARTPQGLDLVHLPLALITPTLDGLASNFSNGAAPAASTRTPPLGRDVEI